MDYVQRKELAQRRTRQIKLASMKMDTIIMLNVKEISVHSEMTSHCAGTV